MKQALERERHEESPPQTQEHSGSIRYKESTHCQTINFVIVSRVDVFSSSLPSETNLHASALLKTLLRDITLRAFLAIVNLDHDFLFEWKLIK